MKRHLFLSSILLLGLPCFLLADGEAKTQPTEQPQTTEKPRARCTAREGAMIYEELGSAMHRQRLQDELSPSEWLTTLMFHRILLPMTAEEHCDLIEFFTDCKSAIVPPEEKNPDMQKTSSCHYGNLPKSNLLIKGTAFVDYTSPEDFNNTFTTGLNPQFFWRYGEKLFYEMELEIDLDMHQADIGVEYANINYIVNKYLTVRAGKFLLPLGFWKEKMHPEWINKFPNPPLPYRDEDNPVIPPGDVGFDMRGAISLGTCGGRLRVPMALSYDFWTANGPYENTDGSIGLDGTNYNDNNNNKAIGARVSFRPWPYREIGISGMRGQWNNNKHGGTISSRRKLFYNALVGEVDCHFNDYLRLCGEYLWTKRDAVVNSDIGVTTKNVIISAWWAQFSAAMNFLDTRYIQNLEPIVRYGAINSGIRANDKREWSFGLNYYMSSKCVFKFAYDVNMGDNFNKNSLNLQWAYAY